MTVEVCVACAKQQYERIVRALDGKATDEERAALLSDCRNDLSRLIALENDSPKFGVRK